MFRVVEIPIDLVDLKKQADITKDDIYLDLFMDTLDNIPAVKVHINRATVKVVSREKYALSAKRLHRKTIRAVVDKSSDEDLVKQLLHEGILKSVDWLQEEDYRTNSLPQMFVFREPLTSNDKMLFTNFIYNYLLFRNALFDDSSLTFKGDKIAFFIMRSDIFESLYIDYVKQIIEFDRVKKIEYWQGEARNFSNNVLD
ncbi:hypothetical protein E5F05_01825 (plasmid) [Deinococcus metallilatus]|uniref:Uncharacterized protein n=1 Tax=Deinococcus metallilatus TaxID=1211322 RepID=A0ABR6MYA4_9DEIO|nr:hypothetical protein [Deinococcus metallilatus]MBB5296913.1 hypothetical protein [Deinococcus metallilatus]QBY06714.1 hypothetical protein E5F05_01825 [Deinococcus metallilatus]GMA15191.1 hypothetical protein GCM10025871_15220 [Deinococcus metallilatus]